MSFVRFFLLESTVIKFWESNTEINILRSISGYKDIQVEKNVFLKSCSGELCRRSVFLLLQDEHIIVLCSLLFVLTVRCILCRYGNFPYEKYLWLEEDEPL